MAKYIPRTCPRCRDYLAVIVSPWPTNDREYDVNGFCAVCGYEIRGWRVILRRKRTTYCADYKSSGATNRLGDA
jgi:hypothetical protein